MPEKTENGGTGPGPRDDAAKLRRQLKRLARQRRKLESRRDDRLDWGRLWREEKLPPTEGEEEDAPDAAVLARQERARRRLSLGADIEPALPDVPLQTGMVIGRHEVGCTILADGREIPGVLRQHLRVLQKTAVAPGDLVEFRMHKGLAFVENVRERKSRISRPDPTNPHLERVIAANVDMAVIVASAASPPFVPSLIDRYLIAAERGNVSPLICLNKMDLVLAPPPEIEPYKRLGIPVIMASARTGYNVPVLADAMAGKLCVFVGHSGTGKSSLLNAIQPELRLYTRSVCERSGKGRHATVVARLYELQNGAKVIDTPGIRELGLWRMTPEELRWYYPELLEVGRCKFPDCTHSHEPDCAVKRALEAGQIARVRYDSYLRILKSLSSDSK